MSSSFPSGHGLGSRATIGGALGLVAAITTFIFFWRRDQERSLRLEQAEREAAELKAALLEAKAGGATSSPATGPTSTRSSTAPNKNRTEIDCTGTKPAAVVVGSVPEDDRKVFSVEQLPSVVNSIAPSDDDERELDTSSSHTDTCSRDDREDFSPPTTSPLRSGDHQQKPAFNSAPLDPPVSNDMSKNNNNGSRVRRRKSSKEKKAALNDTRKFTGQDPNLPTLLPDCGLYSPQDVVSPDSPMSVGSHTLMGDPESELQLLTPTENNAKKAERQRSRRSSLHQHNAHYSPPPALSGLVVRHPLAVSGSGDVHSKGSSKVSSGANSSNCSGAINPKEHQQRGRGRSGSSTQLDDTLSVSNTGPDAISRTMPPSMEASTLISKKSVFNGSTSTGLDISSSLPRSPIRPRRALHPDSGRRTSGPTSSKQPDNNSSSSNQRFSLHSPLGPSSMDTLAPTAPPTTDGSASSMSQLASGWSNPDVPPRRVSTTTVENPLHDYDDEGEERSARSPLRGVPLPHDMELSDIQLLKAAGGGGSGSTKYLRSPSNKTTTASSRDQHETSTYGESTFIESVVFMEPSYHSSNNNSLLIGEILMSPNRVPAPPAETAISSTRKRNEADELDIASDEEADDHTVPHDTTSVDNKLCDDPKSQQLPPHTVEPPMISGEANAATVEGDSGEGGIFSFSEESGLLGNGSAIEPEAVDENDDDGCLPEEKKMSERQQVRPTANKNMIVSLMAHSTCSSHSVSSQGTKAPGASETTLPRWSNARLSAKGESATASLVSTNEETTTELIPVHGGEEMNVNARTITMREADLQPAAVPTEADAIQPPLVPPPISTDASSSNSPRHAPLGITIPASPRRSLSGIGASGNADSSPQHNATQPFFGDSFSGIPVGAQMWSTSSVAEMGIEVRSLQGAETPVSMCSQGSYISAASATMLSHSVTKRAPSSFKRGRKIAHGAHSKVYVCLNEDTGRMMAAKVISFSETDPHLHQRVAKTAQEIKILKSLKHEHIVNYYHAIKGSDGRSMQIFTEYIPNGNLRSTLQQFGGLRPHVASSYVEQLLTALRYLHAEMNIAHLDMKCSNILITPEGFVKLADFGSAITFAPETWAARSNSIGGLLGSSMSLEDNAYLAAVLASTTGGGSSTSGGWGTAANSSGGGQPRSNTTSPRSATLNIAHNRTQSSRTNSTGNREGAHSSENTSPGLPGQAGMEEVGSAVLPPALNSSGRDMQISGGESDARSVTPPSGSPGTRYVSVNEECGTVTHMAPEVIRAEVFDPSACDVWSLGCTVIEMLTGKNPWDDISSERFELLHRVGSISGTALALPEPFATSVSKVSDNLQAVDFVRLCLLPNPRARPSVVELFGHPFAQSFCEAMSPSTSQAGSMMNTPLITPKNADMIAGRRSRGASGMNPFAAAALNPAALSREMTPPHMRSHAHRQLDPSQMPAHIIPTNNFIAHVNSSQSIGSHSSMIFSSHSPSNSVVNHPSHQQLPLPFQMRKQSSSFNSALASAGTNTVSNTSIGNVPPAGTHRNDGNHAAQPCVGPPSNEPGSSSPCHGDRSASPSFNAEQDGFGQQRRQQLHLQQGAQLGSSPPPPPQPLLGSPQRQGMKASMLSQQMTSDELAFTVSSLQGSTSDQFGGSVNNKSNAGSPGLGPVNNTSMTRIGSFEALPPAASSMMGSTTDTPLKTPNHTSGGNGHSKGGSGFKSSRTTSHPQPINTSLHSSVGGSVGHMSSAAASVDPSPKHMAPSPPSNSSSPKAVATQHFQVVDADLGTRNSSMNFSPPPSM